MSSRSTPLGDGRKWRSTPTPPSECVKAVDKGVRRGTGGKATNKGVSGESKANSLSLKTGAGNPELYGGMGKRSRWRVGDGMLPFFRPRRGGGRQGANSGERCRAGFTGGSLRPNCREGYQDGGELSSVISNGLGTRSNGRGKVKARTLHKPKHAAPCRTFAL